MTHWQPKPIKCNDLYNVMHGNHCHHVLINTIKFHSICESLNHLDRQHFHPYSSYVPVIVIGAQPWIHERNAVTYSSSGMLGGKKGKILQTDILSDYSIHKSYCVYSTQLIRC